MDTNNQRTDLFSAAFAGVKISGALVRWRTFSSGYSPDTLGCSEKSRVPHLLEECLPMSLLTLIVPFSSATFFSSL